ncbi:Uncharacterised protein [[Clostridium] sordellii]|uniref:hypothetical protein n=1 Tax=Paraclostridium sordellii TaxID=1505 RepID=UPI0005E2188C|nr:hypothetical protein [Paeniclostridium sordellii]CEP94650.1 Uncharacterised protein [[Clostridium] sordellii] [Paeniclostridium sordellii]
MDLRNFIPIVTLTSTIITMVSTFSKIGENNKLIQIYFEKVVNAYVKEYKNNKNIDPVYFIKGKFNIEDYFIPSYVFYLVDKQKSEKLHKILSYDYIVKFPNRINKVTQLINHIGRVILSGLIFIYYFCLAFSIILIPIVCISLVIKGIFIQGIDKTDIKYILFSTIAPLVIAFILKLMFYNIDIYDDYNMKVRHIEKIIKRKEKKFNKIYKNYYINL